MIVFASTMLILLSIVIYFKTINTPLLKRHYMCLINMIFNEFKHHSFKVKLGKITYDNTLPIEFGIKHGNICGNINYNISKKKLYHIIPSSIMQHKVICAAERSIVNSSFRIIIVLFYDNFKIDTNEIVRIIPCNDWVDILVNEYHAFSIDINDLTNIISKTYTEINGDIEGVSYIDNSIKWSLPKNFTRTVDVNNLYYKKCK
jgi:hypothetical protein